MVYICIDMRTSSNEIFLYKCLIQNIYNKYLIINKNIYLNYFFVKFPDPINPESENIKLWLKIYNPKKILTWIAHNPSELAQNLSKLADWYPYFWSNISCQIYVVCFTHIQRKVNKTVYTITNIRYSVYLILWLMHDNFFPNDIYPVHCQFKFKKLNE